MQVRWVASTKRSQVATGVAYLYNTILAHKQLISTQSTSLVLFIAQVSVCFASMKPFLYVAMDLCNAYQRSTCKHLHFGVMTYVGCQILSCCYYWFVPIQAI